MFDFDLIMIQDSHSKQIENKKNNHQCKHSYMIQCIVH